MLKYLKVFLVLCLVCSSFQRLFAQTELKYTLPELRQLLKSSKTTADRINYQIRISNFYTFNKLYSRKNIDSAVYFAHAALQESAREPAGIWYGRSQLAMAKAKLVTNEIPFILNQIKARRNDIKIQLLIEVGTYYLYKPKEARKDLDSALLLLNQAIKLSKSASLPNLGHLAELYISDVYQERGENIRAKIAFATLIEKCSKAGDFKTAAAANSRWGDHQPLTQEKINYYQSASRLYKQIGDTQAYIGMEKAIADVQLNMGMLKEAERGLISVIQQYQALGYKNLQYTYDLLSVVNRLQGNLKESLFNTILAIKYMEITESDVSKGYFLSNLGSAYAELGNTAASVKAYQQSLEAMQYQNSEARATSLKMLSDGLIREGHIREVLSLTNIYAADSKTPLARVIFATIRGNAYKSLKKYNLAEKYYLQMIYWESKMQSNLFHSAESFYTIAQFYAMRKDFAKSNYYYNKVLALPKGVMPLSSIRNIYYNLYQADSAQNNLQSAIENYKNYKRINDSLVNARSNRDMQELLIQYQANQKEQDNELLRKESILQNNRLQRAEWLARVTVVGLFALLVIVGLSLYGYRNRRKANFLLISHQQEIEIKNNSLQNLIDKQAKLLLEKEWLIKEIHHRIKNNLQVITSLLNAQSNYLQNDAALAAIKDSQNRIQSISLIHQKLFQSDSVALINIHSYIVELMKFLCDTFHVNQRIQFEFNVPEIELDIIQAMPLGLIINEAITNIIKYAFPNHTKGKVIISFDDLENGFYLFSIADNGVGLPANSTTNTSTLGLTLIKGLGNQLGGEIEIKSDQGLKISLKFPALEKEA
ncbi:sensor histidine kinase [Pedobacter rhizosphaerae]|uniref:histidine kinase n=1 Tax=Pedobacter rhizosphaerae TaxID=390241 RepID=A0A1H9VCK8_9SPHI|nr:sensor histidine kinase [Pedobacter rhizosphaerae]SES19309.1 Two-component sensor histidine kinase, contains HisKA and HATPase domains [Pedobacter rhizosphaerae]